ncbi:MAG: hypothetical protein ACI4I1_06170 [Oscillospiraceae bacterium]
MNELKRIYGRKIIMLSAILVLMNFVLFILSCDSERDITAVGDELAEYISSYSQTIESTVKQSQDLSMLNIYSDGFGSKNIIKTAEDFSALSDIRLTYGDNRGVVILSDYHMTDLIFASFMMIISAVLLAERRNGLANLIRSTSGGRTRLYFSRIGVLIISAVLGAVLLYGGNYLGAVLTFGDMGISRTIQSVPEFSMCTYRISVGEYLLYSAGVKILAVSAAALLFFTLISLLGTVGAYLFGGIFAAVQVLFYLLIPSVSSLNVLKYVNIFAAIRADDYFRVYRNLNIFGRPVSILDTGIIFCISILIICFISGIFIHGKMYLKSEHFAERIILAGRKLAEKYAVCRTLFGWEGYKLIVRQYGGIIVICAFLAAYSQAVKYDYFYPQNPYELEWYAKYEGEMTAEKLSDMETQKARLERSIAMFQRMLDKILSEEPVDWNSWGKTKAFLDEAQAKYDTLLPIMENVRSGMEYTERTGNPISLIKPYSYDLLFRRDVKTVRRNSLFILIGIICAVSGVYSFERQNRMDGTLRSAYRGRTALNICKIVWVVLICAVLCVAVHSVQLIRIDMQLGLNDLNAPIQSLDFMRDYPTYMTIRQYIIGKFTARATAACIIGLVCSLISRMCSDMSSSMGICAFATAASCFIPQIVSETDWVSALFWIGR